VTINAEIGIHDLGNLIDLMLQIQLEFQAIFFPQKMQSDNQYKQRNVGGFNPQHLSESRGFDGKKVRRAIQRRTVDYNSTILRYLEVT
jgi:hypothetical protein